LDIASATRRKQLDHARGLTTAPRKTRGVLYFGAQLWPDRELTADGQQLDLNFQRANAAMQCGANVAYLEIEFHNFFWPRSGIALAPGDLQSGEFVVSLVVQSGCDSLPKTTRRTYEGESFGLWPLK
jgi:hypothetical protein